MPTLSLAHSPDPDDVFMWWPLTGMIDPKDPSRVVRPPAIDTGGVEFRAVPADIDVLNRRAIAAAAAQTASDDAYDITAISINTYPLVRDLYALTSFGASVGEGYGPKVVVRDGQPGSVGGSGVVAATETRAALSEADRAMLVDPRCAIAIPGTRTTAFRLLRMVLGATFRFVEMPFDRILDAVASGRAERHEGIRAGLLIHQSQLTYGSMGLRQAVDLGAWWQSTTGLPLTLGGNAVRRDMDARHGAGFMQHVVNLLFMSILHAREHREDSVRYAMWFAPEITREQAERYIDMYVSDLTVDMGEIGLRSIRRLLGDEEIDVLRPLGA